MLQDVKKRNLKGRRKDVWQEQPAGTERTRKRGPRKTEMGNQKAKSGKIKRNQENVKKMSD